MLLAGYGLQYRQVRGAEAWHWWELLSLYGFVVTGLTLMFIGLYGLFALVVQAKDNLSAEERMQKKQKRHAQLMLVVSLMLLLLSLVLSPIIPTIFGPQYSVRAAF